MKLTVLYFAQVAEKLGISTEEIEIESGSNSEDLLRLLKSKHSALNQLTYTMAVNQVLVRSETKLEEGFEIALLPPFAGG